MKVDELHKVIITLKLAKDSTYSDLITESAKDYLRNKLQDAINILTPEKHKKIKQLKTEKE